MVSEKVMPYHEPREHVTAEAGLDAQRVVTS